MQQMRFLDSYALNSLCLNVSSDMSGVRSSAGRLFHTRGPGRRGSFWYVERSVDWSVQIEVAGC